MPPIAGSTVMRIALLEDEDELAELVEGHLLRGGYLVERFRDGRAMVAYLKRETIDLAILDWSVPGLSGRDVLGWLRSHLPPSLPVLFMTSRSDEADIVATLEAGADDYLVKPISLPEATARIAALLRRSYPSVTAAVEEFGRYRFDRIDWSVAIDGAPVTLTPREFELALLLFRNQDRALSRAYLMDRVWKRDVDIVSRTLDVHVSRLREKLQLRAANGYKLTTVYSFGYRLEGTNAGQGVTA